MARPGTLIAALTLAVVLAHSLALQWMQAQWMQPEVLKPLATPMFTRTIAQQAPAAPVAVKAVPPKPAPPVLPPVQVADSTPVKATPTLPEPVPEPLPSLPEPTPSVAAASVPATPTVAASIPAASTTVTVSSYLDAWPADTRLSYKLGGYFRGPLSGDARVQWLRAGDRYEVRIDINIGILASVNMTSQGKVMPQGLYPQLYEEQRGGRRNLSLGDPDIVFNNGTRAPRPPGVQDTASQFVELTQLYASGRGVLEVGQQVSFPMARPGAVDFWTYDVVEKVVLQTPALGAVEAFHLKPRPLATPRGNITAEMWFAPSLQYLPVRIRINMGDDTYVDLMVEKIEQR